MTYLLRWLLLVVSALLVVSYAAVGAALEVRVMPLGDSITQGVTSADHYPPELRRSLKRRHPPNGTSSYRRPLFKMVRQSFVSTKTDVRFVGTTGKAFLGPPPLRDFDTSHSAFWGIPAFLLQKGVKKYVAAQRPHISLVLIGTNDLGLAYSHHKKTEEENPSLEQILTNETTANPMKKVAVEALNFAANSVLNMLKVLSHAMRDLNGEDAKERSPRVILLCKLLPRRTPNIGPLVASFNNALEHYFAKEREFWADPRNNKVHPHRRFFRDKTISSNDVSVEVVDCGKGFDPNIHTYDGLHPNYSGELRIASNLFKPLVRAVRRVAEGVREFDRTEADRLVQESTASEVPTPKLTDMVVKPTARLVSTPSREVNASSGSSSGAGSAPIVVLVVVILGLVFRRNLRRQRLRP